MNIKDKIQAANDLLQETVDIPEWGCDVVIRGMNAGQRGKWNIHASKMVKEADYDFTADMIIPLLIQCLYEPDTNPLKRIFDDTQESKDILASKQLNVLLNLFTIAMRLSGLGPEVKKEIEETF